MFLYITYFCSLPVHSYLNMQENPAFADQFVMLIINGKEQNSIQKISYSVYPLILAIYSSWWIIKFIKKTTEVQSIVKHSLCDICVPHISQVIQYQLICESLHH